MGFGATQGWVVIWALAFKVLVVCILHLEQCKDSTGGLWVSTEPWLRLRYGLHVSVGILWDHSQPLKIRAIISAER